ncbi:hypothetical protein TrVE_jg13550 [Triparma verrucosa]|uniref:Uncharacterized protein n=1 Tax=Triparma verrucosa TaxID=1606542 RepID=A0A9W7FIV3_9STRA|nr:hypothetical protein TrVE_jg13550 [Triparma verrucosa]
MPSSASMTSHSPSTKTPKSAMSPDSFEPSPMPSVEFKPPGLLKSISLSYAPGKLPTCYKCKMLTLPRDVCRVDKGHTALPWSNVFICLITDDTVLAPHPPNSAPAPVLPSPHAKRLFLLDECNYHVEELKDKYDFSTKLEGTFNMETSVCEECRVNFKTKTHCREKNKHTEMPWDVTYVYVTLKKDLTVVEENETTIAAKHVSGRRLVFSRALLISASSGQVTTKALNIKRPGSTLAEKQAERQAEKSLKREPATKFLDNARPSKVPMLQAQLTTGANVGYVLPNAPPTMTMGGMQYAPMGFQVGMNQRFVGMPSGMQVIMPGMQPGVNLGYATPVMMMGMPMHNQLNQFQMLQGQHQQQQMQLYQQMQQHQIQQQILNQKKQFDFINGHRERERALLDNKLERERLKEGKNAIQHKLFSAEEAKVEEAPKDQSTNAAKEEKENATEKNAPSK